MSKRQQKKTLKRLKQYLQKISLLPKIIKCDKCNRLAISDIECLDVDYCRRVNISFLCGSCKFPQYKDTLRTATRGNVNNLYSLEPKIFNIYTDLHKGIQAD